MTIYTTKQKEISETISDDASISNWKNYKWQLSHAIRDIDTFEDITCIEFDEEEKHLKNSRSLSPLIIYR
jgi:lysine 2,3-aminomutase